MPVIVIGADTPVGRAVVDALLPRRGEVRAFVSDPEEGGTLRGRGVKVAVGDVSDGSHVGGAATNAFCAVAVVAAATDGRERAFAADPQAVVDAWLEGLVDAAVSRILVVDDPMMPIELGPAGTAEVVRVAGDRQPGDVAAEVRRLEAVERL